MIITNTIWQKLKMNWTISNPINEKETKIIMDIKNSIGAQESCYTEAISLALKEIGIYNYSYVYLKQSPSESEEAIILGNYPEEWTKNYKKNRLHKKDPVIDISCTTSSPFFWKDRIPQQMESNEIFVISSHYGIHQGFSIPFHEPGCACGSMHFAAEKDNSHFTKTINDHLYFVTVIGYIAHQKRPAITRQPIHNALTARETECLEWIAAGKTYAEVSMILEISERTVRFHTKNIMNKLNSVNIKQVITKAIKSNII